MTMVVGIYPFCHQPGESRVALVDVSIRFRLGKFAYMADLGKCSFQVAMPENQQKLFRLILFANNEIEKGAVQIF